MHLARGCSEAHKNLYSIYEGSLYVSGVLRAIINPTKTAHIPSLWPLLGQHTCKVVTHSRLRYFNCKVFGKLTLLGVRFPFLPVTNFLLFTLAYTPPLRNRQKIKLFPAQVRCPSHCRANQTRLPRGLVHRVVKPVVV